MGKGEEYNYFEFINDKIYVNYKKNYRFLS